MTTKWVDNHGNHGNGPLRTMMTVPYRPDYIEMFTSSGAVRDHGAEENPYSFRFKLTAKGEAAYGFKNQGFESITIKFDATEPGPPMMTLIWARAEDIKAWETSL